MISLLTFKDLKKKITLCNRETQQQGNRLFERLSGKPFWIWDSNRHKQEDIRTNGDCCFNHIIGLPEKNNKERPFYDYKNNIRLLRYQ